MVDQVLRSLSHLRMSNTSIAQMTESRSSVLSDPTESLKRNEHVVDIANEPVLPLLQSFIPELMIRTSPYPAATFVPEPNELPPQPKLKKVRSRKRKSPPTNEIATKPNIVDKDEVVVQLIFSEYDSTVGRRTVSEAEAAVDADNEAEDEPARPARPTRPTRLEARILKPSKASKSSKASKASKGPKSSKTLKVPNVTAPMTLFPDPSAINLDPDPNLGAAIAIAIAATATATTTTTTTTATTSGVGLDDIAECAPFVVNDENKSAGVDTAVDADKAVSESVTTASRPKKRRRRNPNINKQIAMKMNRGIIAWRLAATENAYFTGGTFSKLPKRGTDEYAKIKTRQKEILDFWTLQVAEDKYAMTALRFAAIELQLLTDEANISQMQEALTEVTKPDDVTVDEWDVQRTESANRLAKELLAAQKCFQCFLPIEGYPNYDILRARQLELIEEYTQIELENAEYDDQQGAVSSETSVERSLATIEKVPKTEFEADLEILQ